MKKELGKITHAQFGLGGYQEAMFGLSLTFGGTAWGVGHFIGGWLQLWHSEQSPAKSIDALLREAKVFHVSELIGIPVEVTFDGNKFMDFRVLTEVL